MLTPVFFPTHSGTLYTGLTYDARGKEIEADPVPMRYTPIRVRNSNEKTSIRTDKSASQSRAEEQIFDGRILVHPSVTPKQGRKVILLSGESYKIEVVQAVFDSPGVIDHWQCDLLL